MCHNCGTSQVFSSLLQYIHVLGGEMATLETTPPISVLHLALLHSTFGGMAQLTFTCDTPIASNPGTPEFLHLSPYPILRTLPSPLCLPPSLPPLPPLCLSPSLSLTLPLLLLQVKAHVCMCTLTILLLLVDP